MFTNRINDIAMSSVYADELFPNFHADELMGDTSFLASLRAFLHSRIEEGEEVVMHKFSVNYAKEEAACMLDEIKTAAEKVLNNYILIYSLDGNTENNDACFEALKKVDPEKLFGEGWTRMNDVEHKFTIGDGKTGCQAFSNYEECKSVIIVERLNLSKWHLFQALIPRYFKKLFMVHPRTEIETEIALSLVDKDGYEKYLSAMAKIASQFDFKSAKIRKELAGFEKRFERERLKAKERELEDVRFNIQRIQNEFSDYFKREDLLTTEIFGLNDKIRRGESSDNEIMEMFIKNEGLELIRANGASLEFVILTEISNYDPEAAQSCINNPVSYMYDYTNDRMTSSDLKLLLNALFVEDRMRIRVLSAFSADFSNGIVNGIRGYQYAPELISTRIPNYHIHDHACLGTNRELINAAMRTRDYSSVIDACWASASNYNFMDSAVGPKFIQELCNGNKKFIALPDGTLLSPKEAVEWIKKQDNI